MAGIGALAIPGLGPFIATGPIMGTLAGLGIDGAVGGLMELWWARAFRSTKLSDTKAELSRGSPAICPLRHVGRNLQSEGPTEGDSRRDISSAGEKAVSSHGGHTDTPSPDV
jgi:hypothetical protein